MEGTFHDYDVALRSRLGAAAATPHRIRYKKLTAS